MNFAEVEEGMKLRYTGNSFAFGGEYTIIAAESTYANLNDCPDDEKGMLMIIEFMNDGTPMYFTLDRLNPQEWVIAN